jgi:hypothetical protein
MLGNNFHGPDPGRLGKDNYTMAGLFGLGAVPNHAAKNNCQAQLRPKRKGVSLTKRGGRSPQLNFSTPCYTRTAGSETYAARVTLGGSGEVGNGGIAVDAVSHVKGAVTVSLQGDRYGKAKLSVSVQNRLSR